MWGEKKKTISDQQRLTSLGQVRVNINFIEHLQYQYINSILNHLEFTYIVIRL